MFNCLVYPLMKLILTKVTSSTDGVMFLLPCVCSTTVGAYVLNDSAVRVIVTLHTVRPTHLQQLNVRGRPISDVIMFVCFCSFYSIFVSFFLL